MKNVMTVLAVALVVGFAATAGAATWTEDFESGWAPQANVGTHAEWWSSGGGPHVDSGYGVGDGWGMEWSGTPFYWTAHPFDWSDPLFVSYTGSLDFKTDGGTHFNDSRVGFYYGALGTSSSNVMSVQLDDSGGVHQLEGYWDGVGGADKRPLLANLDGLIAANSWYRFQATFTKTAITNEPIIDVSLHAVNPDGSAGALIHSSSLDTATLPAGDRPHTKYFTGPNLPSYKNYDTDNYADNALATVNVIPEPSTMVLAVLGLAGLLVLAWRRRS